MGKTIGILAVCVAVYVAAVLLKRKKVPTIRMTFLLDVIQTGVVIFLIFFAILQIPSAHDTWDRVLVGSGAAAVVIGLAAQASLGNIFSGIMVLTSRPFEIGEKIQVGDTVGTVKLMKFTAHTPSRTRSVWVEIAALSGASLRKRRYTLFLFA